jgi:hypothetical protein
MVVERKWLAALVVALICAPLGTRAESRAAAPELLLRWGEKEVFPSVLFALQDGAPFPVVAGPHDLGDPISPICVAVTAPADDCPVRVTLAATALYDESRLQVRLPRRGETYRLAPVLRLAYDRFARLDQPIAGELIRAKVELAGTTHELSIAPRIHSLHNFLSALLVNGRIYELGHLLAAYVDEYNAALVTRVTRHALDRGYVDRFDGYASGDPAKVRRQVAALYRSLHDLRFGYTSMIEPTFRSSDTRAQNVRLVGDTLRVAQSNCVDGSVLFASLLTQLGLRATIFFQPITHTVVGVHLHPRGLDDSGLLVIETTVLDREDFEDSIKTGAKVVAGFRKKYQREVRLTGPRGFELYSWTEDQKRPDVFFRIEIAAARARGVLPLPVSLSPL